jgi:hypothetical protein
MNKFGFILGIFGLAGTIAIGTEIFVEQPDQRPAALAQATRPPILASKDKMPAAQSTKFDLKQGPPPITDENPSERLAKRPKNFAQKAEAPIPNAADWLAGDDERRPAARDNETPFNFSNEVDNLATSSIDKGAIALGPVPLQPSVNAPKDRTALPAISPEQKPRPRASEKPQNAAPAPKPRFAKPRGAPAKKTASRRPPYLTKRRMPAEERQAWAFAQAVMKVRPTGSGFFISSHFDHGSLRIPGF